METKGEEVERPVGDCDVWSQPLAGAPLFAENEVCRILTRFARKIGEIDLRSHVAHTADADRMHGNERFSLAG